MLRRVLVLFFVFGLVISCSTDGSDEGANDGQISMDDDGMMEEDSPNDSNSDDTMDDGTDDSNPEEADLIGLWVLSEIRLDEGLDDITLELLDLVIDDLVEEECYLISFDFKDDGTVDIESRVGDFEVVSIEITCPEEVESVTAEWELNGNQLTLNDGVETPETITIVLEDENTLLIEGEEGIDEEFDGSQAVFIRIQG